MNVLMNASRKRNALQYGCRTMGNIVCQNARRPFFIDTFTVEDKIPFLTAKVLLKRDF